jgi:hypothetical protein
MKKRREYYYTVFFLGWILGGFLTIQKGDKKAINSQ